MSITEAAARRGPAESRDGALREADTAAVDAIANAMRERGGRTLTGTWADSAGVIRAKQVPIARAAAFHRPGLGASPTLAVLCADDAVGLTPSVSVVGDMRLRADLETAVDLGDGFVWAPVELSDQGGRPMPFCWRTALRDQETALEDAGLRALAAVEMEFALFDAHTSDVAGYGGPAYGVGPLLDHTGFVDDVHRSFEAAGLPLEQLHAEYSPGQFEISLPPATPLAAADANVLARILLGRAARRHGLRVSFSPLPNAGQVGSGAHVHLSFTRDGLPILSGGDGVRGLTDEGSALLAGLVRTLPEAIGVLAPSLLSSGRLAPGHYAGAFACWGVENREAAVRMCAATPGNPRGAHVEVKCVDPAANPYVVQAVLLGMALHGVRERLELPCEVLVDPKDLAESERRHQGIVPIGVGQAAALDALERSDLMTRVLGVPLLETLVAVRRHEVAIAAESRQEDLVERFRFAWSA